MAEKHVNIGDSDSDANMKRRSQRAFQLMRYDLLELSSLAGSLDDHDFRRRCFALRIKWRGCIERHQMNEWIILTALQRKIRRRSELNFRDEFKIIMLLLSDFLGPEKKCGIIREASAKGCISVSRFHKLKRVLLSNNSRKSVPISYLGFYCLMPCDDFMVLRDE